MEQSNFPCTSITQQMHGHRVHQLFGGKNDKKWKKKGKKRERKSWFLQKIEDEKKGIIKEKQVGGQQEHSVCPACFQEQLKARIYVDDRRQFRVVLYSIL